MAEYDFSGPWVAARIRDIDGNLFPFWTNLGGSESDRPQIPGGDELQALAFLQGVEVRLQQGGAPPIITANLTPPYREGIQFINSDLISGANRNLLEVQFGYVGGTGSAGSVLSPVFVGVLDNPDVTIDVDVQITLHAQGIGGWSMGRQHGSRVSRRSASGEANESRRQLMRRILSRHNVGTDFSDADSNSEARAALDAVVTYAQGGKTDWMALWELATQARCQMSLVGDTLFFFARENRQSSEPTRRFRLYDYPGGRLQGLTIQPGATGQTTGEYPILSFSSPSSAVYLPSSQFGTFMSDIDDRSRVRRSVQITQETDPVPGSAEGDGSVDGSPNNPAPTEEGDGGEVLPGDPADPDTRVAASEEHARSAHLGIRLEIETIGIPDIFPGEVVRVAGGGWRFDEHNWMVFEVNHNIGDGFTTNLVLQSNVDVTRPGGGVTNRGAPNRADVQEGSADTATVTPTVQEESA